VIRVNNEKKHGSAAAASRTPVLSTKLNISLKDSCITCTIFVVRGLKVRKIGSF
jgi:hypothetical protein